MGWIRTPSLRHRVPIWVPAQLASSGLSCNQEGEEWLQATTTTGGAAHTDHVQMLRNALLELNPDRFGGRALGIPPARAPEIIGDGRTRALERLIDRHFAPGRERPRFYWLPNPDLPGMTVACLLGEPGSTPAAAVGLGSDLKLAKAMYKALLEAVGVVQLAKIVLLAERFETSEGNSVTIDPGGIMDLDGNVAYYALPANANALRKRFGGGGPDLRFGPPT